MSSLSIVFLLTTAIILISLRSDFLKVQFRRFSLSEAYSVVVCSAISDLKTKIRGRITSLTDKIGVSSLDNSFSTKKQIEAMQKLVDCHQTAALLADLIHTDGAGTWPPLANHDHSTWPPALQPYRDVCQKLIPHLAVEKASLDDYCNINRIATYRQRFHCLLRGWL